MDDRTYPVTPVTLDVDMLHAELDTERAMTKDMRKAVAEAVGYFKSDDGSMITEWIEDRLCINGGMATEYFRYDHVKNLRAENERLQAELTLRLRQLAQASTDYGQLLTAHETLRAELDAYTRGRNDSANDAPTRVPNEYETDATIDGWIWGWCDYVLGMTRKDEREDDARTK